MLLRIYVAIFITSMLALQGCVAIQAFPVAARSGETITLAVGSPDGMTKTNTTVQFVSGSYSANLPIRSIIRLRPDNTSFVGAFDAFTGSIQYSSSHGPWLTVLVIDLSTGLPAGPATLNVTTAAQYVGANVNTTPIAITILSGEGVSNPFQYDPMGWGSADGDLSDLEPLPQVVIRPPANGFAVVNPIAAMEIKVNVPARNISTGGQVPAAGFNLIADDVTSYQSSRNVQMNWSRAGDDYTVYFVSPVGGLYFFQARFSVVLSGNTNYQFVTTPGPSVTSVRYFDTNGNLVTSGQPTASAYSATIEHQ